MPIYGLTDPETRAKNREEPKRKKPAVEIAKGHRQIVTRVPKKGGKQGETETKKEMGRDLLDKLRITVNKPNLAKILEPHYKTLDRNGDFIVESVNIFFPSDDLDVSCPSQMEAYRKSGFVLACDRRNIIKRSVEKRNETGVYRQIIDVQEPCPMAGKPLAQKCPNKCEQTAQLQVHVKELFLSEYMYLAILDFGGFEDLGSEGIIAQMERWQDELGSLIAPPPHPITNVTFRWKVDRGDGTSFACDRIPFILSRREISQLKPVLTGGYNNKYREGTKFEGKAWILDIHPDPMWLANYRQWQQIQEDAAKILRSGYRLRAQAIAGLFYGVPISDRDVIDATALPQLEPAREEGQEESPVIEVQVAQGDYSYRPVEVSPHAKIDEGEGEILIDLWRNTGWSSQAFLFMLFRNFGISKLGDIERGQYLNLCQLAQNPEKACEWAEKLRNVQAEFGWTPEAYHAMLRDEFGGKISGQMFAQWCEVVCSAEMAQEWNKRVKNLEF